MNESFIEPLTASVYGKLTVSNAFATAMGGRIFYEQYKSVDGSLPVTFPYAIFFYVADTPEYTFTSNKENVLLQISVFDTASSAVSMLAYISQLTALMDFVSLTPTGWTLIECRRQSIDVISPDAVKGARHGVVTYRILGQKV